MAIAPSKLGRVVSERWDSDEALLRRLRQAGLVKKDVSDTDLRATFQRAREEHAALAPRNRDFNSPNERVRVFLGPFLSRKGRQWAEPLKSLELPDDDMGTRSRWWKFWG
jgi:hypothetical protein